MAEGLLRQMLADRSMDGVRVRSAGTHALDGRGAEPYAVEAASELGADISAHEARSLDREMVLRADLILVMEQGQADVIARVLPPARKSESLRLLAEFNPAAGRSEVDDPYGLPLADYHGCARIIQECLIGVLDQIAERSTKS